MQENSDTIQIDAVQRMQNYIKNHLTENITLADLSKVAMFSPWYSHRLFSKYTGVTISDYIRKLRLSASAIRLRDEASHITDIAYDSGFESVDGYQRAFLREFGCNPKQFAKNPVPIYLFTPYGVKFTPNNTINKNIEGRPSVENLKNVFIQVIDKPERKVIIKRGIKTTQYFDYCEEVGCDVWGLLQSIKALDGEPVCLWLPKKYQKACTSAYVQGVEVPVNYNGVIPEGFDIIILPAAKYLMFQGEPFSEENYATAIEEVQLSIKKYNPSIIGYEWDDENPRIQLEPIGTRGYIELAAIK